MDIEIIKQLLEKYFEGETSLEEERVLATYFNSDRVGEDLKKYQPLFAFFAVEKQILIPSKKQKAKIIAYDFHKKLIFKRIAAILLLAVGSFWLYKQKGTIQNANQTIATVEQSELNDTEETPEIAYQKAKAALLLVSSKMKRGTEEGAAGIQIVKTSLDKIK